MHQKREVQQGQQQKHQLLHQQKQQLQHQQKQPLYPTFTEIPIHRKSILTYFIEFNEIELVQNDSPKPIHGIN